MTLITRISRMFKADMHGILDAIEEPQAMLKQAMREMENEIARSEELLAAKAGRRKFLASAKEEQAAAFSELEHQINLVFSAHNEDLAKALVRKKLELAQRSKTIEQALRTIEGEITAASGRIKEQKDKLQEISARMKLADASAVSQRSGEASFGGSVSDEDVEVAFLAEKSRRAAKGQAAGAA